MPSSILIMQSCSSECCGTTTMYLVQDAVPSLLVAVPFTMLCPLYLVGGAGSGGYAFMTSSTSPSEKLARTLPLLPAHDMHGCWWFADDAFQTCKSAHPHTSGFSRFSWPKVTLWCGDFVSHIWILITINKDFASSSTVSSAVKRAAWRRWPSMCSSCCFDPKDCTLWQQTYFKCRKAA